MNQGKQVGMRKSAAALVFAAIIELSGCASGPMPAPATPSTTYAPLWIPPPPPPPPPSHPLGPLPGDYSLSVVSKPAPQYPEYALKHGHQGSTVVRLIIDRDGQILAVTVSRSSGFPELDQAATAAAWTWKFHPGRHHGVATGGVVELPVNFSLPPVPPMSAKQSKRITH